MKMAQVAYCMYSLTCLGLFLDHHPRVVAMEIARLAVLLAALTQSSAIFVGESLHEWVWSVNMTTPTRDLLNYQHYLLVIAGASSVSLVFSNPIILVVPVAASLLLWCFKLLSSHAQATPTKLMSAKTD